MSDASLGTATLHTKLDTTGLTTGFRQAEAQGRQSLGALDNQLSRLGSQLSGIGTKLSVGVTLPLTALAGVGVRSAMQLETFSASLRVLIGDADRANKVFKELYEFDASTPFNWQSLTEATRVLAAFGVEAEDIVGTLSMLGDVASGVQTPIEDLAEIYGRVQVTGRLGMEEVNRLAERGIPIYTELASQLGVAEGQVRDLVSAGSVGFPELQSIFTRLTSEGGKFFGMMDAQADTVAGRLQNLRSSFEQVTDAIGKGLLPIFDRMIVAGQAATDWFNDLDEGAQSTAIALGLAAAATGPLTLGLGRVVTVIPRVVSGLRALTTVGLAAFGPAGWIAAGVFAVTSLVAVLSMRQGGSASLEAAIDAVDVAADNATAIEGFDTTMTNLATNLGGPVKRAFEGTVGDLYSIVTAAEDAREALARISLGTELAGQVQRDTLLRSSVESAFTIGADNQPAQQLRDALFRGAFSEAAEVVGDLIRRYNDIGSQADVARLTMFLNELNSADEALTNLLSGRTSNNRVGAGSSGAGAASGAPTGSASDPVTVRVTEAPTGYGLPWAAQVGAVAGQAYGIARDTDQALRDASIAGWMEQLEVNAELWRQAAEIRADTAQAMSDAGIGRDGRALTASAFAEIMPLIIPALRLPDDSPTAMAEFVPDILMSPRFAQSIELTATAFATLAPAVGLTASAFAEVGGTTATSINQLRGQIRQLEGLRDSASSPEVRRRIANLIEALEVQLAQMLREAAPSIAKTLDKAVLEVPARFGGRTPGDSINFTRNTGVETAAEAAERIKAASDAANRLAEGALRAGFAFGEAAIKSFKDGDIVGLIKAGIGGTQSVLGSISGGPMMSLLGGSIPVLGLISGALGLIGSLFGSGGRNELPTARAAAAAARSAPAVDLRVIINNNLSLQSLTDPASRRAVDGLVDDMVRRIEDTLKRNVLPRLDALEGAA